MQFSFDRASLSALLLLSSTLAACSPSSGEDILLDGFASEADDALSPALSCAGATVCADSLVRPQCLAASMEANYGFEAYQTINVPSPGTYSFLRLTLRRFYARTDGSFRAELREFPTGSTALGESVLLTTATVPGALLPRINASVTLRFESPVTLAPAVGATPRYVLVFKVTGGTSLSVGIGCAESLDVLPGLTAGGRKLLMSGGLHVPQPWSEGRRVVALALGNAPSGYGACFSTPGATCDDGNTTSGDGCSASCQPESGFTCTGLPSTCTSDNDCLGNGCLNGATCIDGTGAYSCACVPGFTGPFCGTNTDDCASNPCLNGGTCTDGVDTFTCACPTGRAGPTCADCAPGYVLNGSTCEIPIEPTVAVNTNGAGYSTNAGATWTNATGFPVSGFFGRVTGGGGRYVAVNNNLAWVSSNNGVSWTSGTIGGGTGTYRDVAYGGGRFVAVSVAGNVAAYSTNGGTSWTEVALGYTGAYRAIAYGNGRFVAGGASGVSGWSTNGSSWTAANFAPTADAHMNQVAFGNGVFVAATHGSGNVYTTTDGTAWTKQASAQAGTQVAYGGGSLFVMTSGGSQTPYRSNNSGVTWAAASAGPGMGNIAALAFGNGKFTAVSASVISYSTDGNTWTAAASYPYTTTTGLDVGDD